MHRTVWATALLAIGAIFGALPEAQAQSLVPCAREHGFCRVPYPTRVVYGIPGRSTEVFVREGGVPCSNRVFGDPAPGAPTLVIKGLSLFGGVSVHGPKPDKRRK